MFHFDKKQLRAAVEGRLLQTRQVAFQDIDAAGIVFFPRVLEYLHDGYVELLADCGQALPRVLRKREWAAPIRHAEADYFAPLRFGQVVEVRLVAAHVEPTEITLGYQVRCEDGSSAAVGQTVHTFVDAASFERRPVPEPLAEALRPWVTPD